MTVSEDGAINPLRGYLDRIWRGRWLVVLVTALAVLGVLTNTVLQPTTYTARSTLSTATENRSPDQDAYLASGYAQYFNEESYLRRIRAIAQVPAEVEISARTGATSPILYIEVTATDPDRASTIAGRVAERFRDDIRGEADISRDQVISGINEQIADKRTLLNQFRGASDERLLIIQEIFDLEKRVNDLLGNTANQLTDLQRDAGVSDNPISPVRNALLGLVGGLLLGCALALALATLRGRLTTAQDVREQLGMDTIAVLGGRRRETDGARAHRLKTLATVVSLSGLGRPATIAVVAPGHSRLVTEVAEGLVYYRAAQGVRAVLVRTDLRDAATATRPDADPQTGDGMPADAGSGPRPLWGRVVAELLATDRVAVPHLTEVAVGGVELRVLPAGRPESGGEQRDPYALFAPERVAALIDQLTGDADLVVLEVPALLDAAESQVICAAADRTILVVEEGVTPAADAREGCRQLSHVGAGLLGVVIGRATSWRAASEPFGTLPLPRPASAARDPGPTEYTPEFDRAGIERSEPSFESVERAPEHGVHTCEPTRTAGQPTPYRRSATGVDTSD